MTTEDVEDKWQVRNGYWNFYFENSERKCDFKLYSI